ncbi:MAG: metallophosphoesterase [Planctomycetota bacterium]|jgi:putative phosphoesterase
MKVAIISDTHDRQKVVVKAAEIFDEEKVDYILHAGDIVSPETAERLAQAGGKFIAVFGNCDHEKDLLVRCVTDLGGEMGGRVFRGQIGNRRIFMTHKPSTLGEVSRSDNFDLVVYGHTHKQLVRRVGQTLVVNPGISAVVVVELDNMEVKEIRLR